MHHSLRHGLIAVAAVLAPFGVAIADPIEDGQAAYNRGDFQEALRQWQPLAEQGVARAQNNLGVMYENGKGVAADINQALKWYLMAAAQGYAGAQNNLGLIYALGKGVVPADPVRAYMWLSLAASGLSGDVGKTVAESRDVVASSMRSEQLASATELARKCQESGFKQCGDGDSPTLASLYAKASPSQAPAYATTSHDVTPNDYPRDSVRLHESGAVTVTYVVNEMGSVSECTVVLSSGIGRLDEAACIMVKRRWKYTPAMQDGKPASIQYVSTINFPRR
jgi:TonB family protein